NTMRCAPIPSIAIVTPGASRTAPAPVRRPDRTVRTTARGRIPSVPSAFAANPAAAIAPTSEPLTPRRTAVPEPVSPAPTNPMVATAVAAPTAETPEPTVAITELTGTKIGRASCRERGESGGGAVSGHAAEHEACADH